MRKRIIGYTIIFTVVSLVFLVLGLAIYNSSPKYPLSLGETVGSVLLGHPSRQQRSQAHWEHLVESRRIKKPIDHEAIEADRLRMREEARMAAAARREKEEAAIKRSGLPIEEAMAVLVLDQVSFEQRYEVIYKDEYDAYVKHIDSGLSDVSAIKAIRSSRKISDSLYEKTPAPK